VAYVGDLSRPNVAALPDRRPLAVAQHRLPDAPPIVLQIPARLGHSELRHSRAVQSAPGKELHGIEIFPRFEIIRTRPDVALVSGVLQESSFAGYSVLRAIQPLNLATRPILLLEDCEHDLVIDAFRSGARGVFSRAESSERLSKCAYTVHKGQIWASTREMDYILEELVATRPLRIVDARGCSLLSKREEEVVALVADGLTNRQISEQLKLSEHTVKNYLFKVFEKLGISTRVELVLYALSQNHRSDPATTPLRIPQPARRQPATLPLVAGRIGI
jgi:DNA-binding NarL/FixJ family response regulator